MAEAYNSPGRARKAGEVVARRIVRYIAEQGLLPGAILPQELELQGMFGAGRGTLREALRLLETQGVLSLKAGRGPLLLRPTPEYLLNSLTLLLQFQDATFETLLTARPLFEPTVTFEAAKHITDEELDDLRVSIDKARAEIGNMPQLVHREFEFHRTIAHASRNLFAESVVTALTAALSSEAFEIPHQHDTTSDLQYHEEILVAMTDHDSERAAALMREHVDDTLTKVRRLYPDLLKRPVRWM